MSDTQRVPTDEAWEYFTRNQANIRAVVEQFIDKDRIPLITGEAMVDGPRYTIEQFDEAAQAKNVSMLADIMNSAWLRAPETREVYRIPGFTQMCNLLDETVEGFLGERLIDDDEDEDEDEIE